MNVWFRVNDILDTTAFNQNAVQLHMEDVEMAQVVELVFDTLQLLKKPEVILWKQVAC